MKRIKNRIAFMILGYHLRKALKELVSQVDNIDIKEKVGEVYAG